MLKTSKAALFAAMLGLSAPVIGIMPAVAQEMKAPAFDMKLEVPTITAIGSSMSESQLKDLFTSKFLSSADALARLTAESISIPEIKFSATVNDGTMDYASTIAYRDIVFTNIRDGYAEKVTIGSMESVSTDGTTTYGPSVEDGFDLRRTLELVGIVKGDAGAAMKPLYNAYSMSGGKHVGPMINCTFGEISGTMVEARPVKVPFAELMDALSTFSGEGEPPPAAIKSFVGYISDILRAFRGGATNVGAVECSGAGETEGFTLSLGGASSGDFEPGVYPNFTISDLAVDAGEAGNGSLGALVFKTIDLNPMLEALDSASDSLNEAWFDKNWRRIIPSFEGLSFANLALDAMNPETPGERVKAKIANFDLSLGKYVLGIPTDIAMSGAGIEVPLPQTSTDPQIVTLLAAGLTDVNMGFDVKANWDEAAQTIKVDNVSLAAVDLGGMSVSAEIGNATPALFAINPDEAMLAGLGLTVKSLTIKASDDGVGEIVWPLAASEQGATDIEAFRAQMAGFSEGLAIQLLGSSDASRQLGVAISEFVTGKKGEITITMTAKDAAGIPMAMFVAAQNDPSILNGQFEVSGTAN